MISCVLYLYEFTLLSNDIDDVKKHMPVLYLYEFTLLSNGQYIYDGSYDVLYLYEFTLLSNQECGTPLVQGFYTSMNLHCSQTALGSIKHSLCFIPL